MSFLRPPRAAVPANLHRGKAGVKIEVNEKVMRFIFLVLMHHMSYLSGIMCVSTAVAFVHELKQLGQK